MTYFDNDYKFIAILNRNYDTATLTNALAHTMAGFMAARDVSSLAFLDYTDADATVHSTISRFPVIVLAARNGDQIRSLREGLVRANLPCNSFCDTMLGASAESQLLATRSKAERDLDWMALVAFGPRELLDPLTKKFSVFKGPSVAACPALPPAHAERLEA